MKRILIREDELRASPEIQSRYSQTDDLELFRDITLDLQRQALRECDIPEQDIYEALSTLHNARRFYQYDPEMNKLTVYQRLDRSRQGNLISGDKAPNVPLNTADGKQVMLYDYIDQTSGGKPLFVFAGSIS